MVTQNALKNIVVAVRDQLRTNIVGGTGYNYDLSHKQVQIGDYNPENIGKFPFVCVASARETMDNEGLGPQYVCSFELEILGYVQTGSEDEATDSALLEAANLLSDIESAVLVDDTLGIRRVGGLSMDGTIGNYDRFAVCVLVLRGTYRQSG